MFVLSEPVYPRTGVEKAFLGLYGIAVLINFAAIVITLASYKHRLDQTYSTFSGSSATMSDGLTVLLRDCSFTDATFTLGGMEASAFIDESSAPVMFLSNSLVIVGAIAVMFIIFLNDIFAKGCFGANIRHFRIRGVTMPVNTIAANAMLVQSIGILILIGTTSSSRTFLNKYVQHCATRFSTNNLTEFLERENDVQNVFGTDLGLIVVAVSVNLAFYFFAFIALCVEAFTDAAAEFERRKFYWETNNFGVPDDKELFHYSKWRRFAIDSIGEGLAEVELAPVSYLEWMQQLEEAKRRWASDPRSFRFGGGSPLGEGAEDAEMHERIAGIHDQQNLDKIDGGGAASTNEGDDDGGEQAAAQGTAASIPLGGAQQQPPQFNPFRISNDDEPEELIMPEAFDDEEGDYFVDEFAAQQRAGSMNNHHHHHHQHPQHQQQQQQQPYYNNAQPESMYSNRAGSGGSGTAPSPSQHADRPFERRRSISNGQDDDGQQQQQQQQLSRRQYPTETEEERKERHRLRRMQETAEERAARKERRRRVQQLVATAGAFRSASGGGRPLAPPLPSP